VAGGIYIFSDVDYCVTAYSARIRFQNNLVWIAPLGTPPSGSHASGWAVQLQGGVDVILNQNTAVIDASNPNMATKYTAGIYDPGTAAVNYLDRGTFTNNILDGYWAFSGTAGPSGTAALDDFLTNYSWTNQLTILDDHTFPGTNYLEVAYESVGFADFVSNATMPAVPSDWNVTTGAYATASTTDGPLGCTFPTISTALKSSVSPRSALPARR